MGASEHTFLYFDGIFVFKIYFYLCVVCMLHVYGYILQKSALYVSQLMWVLGMEVLSSRRALSIPNPGQLLQSCFICI